MISTGIKIAKGRRHSSKLKIIRFKAITRRKQ